jgi:hypothetical protein
MHTILSIPRGPNEVRTASLIAVNGVGRWMRGKTGRRALCSNHVREPKLHRFSLKTRRVKAKEGKYRILYLVVEGGIGTGQSLCDSLLCLGRHICRKSDASITNHNRLRPSLSCGINFMAFVRSFPHLVSILF